MAKIRVLLVDDHPVTRIGIRHMFKSATDIAIVAEAATGQEALALIEQHHPDIVLLDIDLPDMSGLEVARRLQQASASGRVVILSGYVDITYIRDALTYGAWGYLTKEEPLQTIIAAIRGVAQGERGWMSRRVVDQVRTPVRDHEMLVNLTQREKDVLYLIAQGKPNQEIARALQISEKAVEKHVASIMSRLNARSRVDAAVHAVRLGLYPGRDPCLG